MPLVRRHGVLIAILVGGVVVAALLSLSVGARTISPALTVDALLGSAGGTDAVVVRTLRLPRTLLGIAVGVALGIAGALIQAITRNPLADPGLIGVNAGASLMVVLSITLLGWSGLVATTGAAVLGAGLTLAVVLLLTSRGTFSPLVVVLVGTAFSATIGGITSGLLILHSSALDQVRFWSIGSLTGRDPDLVWPALLIVAVATLIGVSVAVPLATMAMGEEMASTLGTSVVRTRVIVLCAVALLCGAATAVAGPIGFVGLAVPFLARRLARGDILRTLMYSGALGATVLLVADVIGRIVVRPAELEVGVLVAIVGAPLLIFIARSSRIERP
ncbi:iron ABC transporter permease [uncultured Aeromicrobium sp.]|uniref:FecCD family ABC transporter permease n=1 Tax=uncultured Aeromicrobium sp. TaxID=337820 RepID=UPI0025ED45F3|nr:iron ABC transporter permease [uncultured Aeromicrobium sp.]